MNYTLFIQGLTVGILIASTVFFLVAVATSN